MTLSQKEAAKRVLQVRNAELSFVDFVKSMHPEWKIPKFQYTLMHALNLLEKRNLYSGFTGDTDKKGNLIKKNQYGEPVYNILINMPPRHAKSTFATQLFPAYYMGRNPSRYVMSTSYNASLAVDFGRAVRSIAEEPIFPQIFPHFAFDQTSRAADVWRTTDNGAYFGIGMGGTTSGRPANLLIIDDPIKNRQEAESMTTRNNAWNYYISALTTRLQPEANGSHPIQIMILTRWHPDDPGGRIQLTEDWRENRWLHINFPAKKEVNCGVMRSVAELPPDDPRHIKTGELSRVSPKKRHYSPTKIVALWPERFPLDNLNRIERLNPREFAALYQQSPYIEGGNIIKADWWKFYDPEIINPTNFSAIIIAADTAFKKTETADYSVFLVGGLATDGDIYIIDRVKGRYDFPELKQKAVHLNTKYRGKGLRGLYIEDKASGQSLIQELKHESGVSVIAYKVNADKVARAHTVTPLIEGGRVWLPQGAHWVDDFIDATVSFPSAVHDDDVDALSILLDSISKMHVGASFDAPINVSESLNNHYSKHRDSISPLSELNTWRGWGL
jgi:predicted phage terminase large subunit-like protein